MNNKRDNLQCLYKVTAVANPLSLSATQYVFAENHADAMKAGLRALVGKTKGNLIVKFELEALVDSLQIVCASASFPRFYTSAPLTEESKP